MQYRAGMSDLAGPVARALIAYFDALAQLEDLTANGPGTPPDGDLTIARRTEASSVAAHDAIHALRHFLEVSRDEPILTQHYQTALDDLIAKYGDPDSAT